MSILMKNTKQFAAMGAALIMFISSSISASAFSQYYDQNKPGAVLTAMPEGMQIKTEILDDGTIVTKTWQEENPDNPQIKRIRPDGLEVEDYLPFYALSVQPEDANSFAAAFSETYTLFQEEDGSYLVAEAGNKAFANPPHASGMNKADAGAAADAILASGTAQFVTLLHQYEPGNNFTLAYQIRLFSEVPLTQENFTFLGEDYTVQLNQPGGVKLLKDGKAVDSFWAEDYKLLFGALTQIDSVYAVDVDIWYDEGSLFNRYASEETRYPKGSGDFDGDGKVSTEDAQNVLMNYTEIIAGNKPAMTDAQKKAADVNGDGTIDSADAQLILLYYVQNALAGTPTTWEELLLAK